MPKKFLICLISFCVGIGTGGAQDTTNPFELIFRLEKKSVDTARLILENPFEVGTPKKVVPAGEVKALETENPFEVSPPSATGNKTAPTMLPKEKDKSPSRQKKEPVPDKMAAPAFIFWFLGFILLVLAISVTAFRNHLNYAYKAFTNENFLKLLFRQQTTFLSLPLVVFYLLFFVNAGLFLFFSGQKFGILPSPGTLLILIVIIGVLMLAFSLKHLCLNIIAYVFPIGKVLGQYSFTIVIFGIILGVVLVPVNIIIPYASPELSTIALWFGWAGILGIYLFLIARSLFLASKIIFFHKFHFFIYLCTVEIAPLIVVVKLIYGI